MRRRDKKPESSWTSYSDLFSAIAVVFIILFVFSSLVTEVSEVISETSIEDMKTASLSKKQIEKQREQNKKVMSYENLMKNNQKEIAQSIEGFQNLVKDIEKLV